MQAWAAIGVVLSVHPIGRWALGQHSGGATNTERAMIQTCAGAAAWTLFMMAVAAGGLFHLAALGVVGWLIVLASAWRGRSSFDLDRCKARPRLLHARGHAWLGLLIVCAASVLYLVPPKQSILGERDEGIYVQHAMHLARTGGSAIDLAALGLRGERRIEAISDRTAPPLPGIYPAPGRWTFQFSAATPVWMAVLEAGFGPLSGLRFNAIVGLLNCLAFYLLVRRSLPPGGRMWAAAALSAFAFNAAQVWISRNTLSEPFASWFLVCGLLAATTSMAGTGRRMGVVAGVLIGMATFVRIDSVILAVAVLAAWAIARLTGASEPAGLLDRRLGALASACVATNLLAMLYFGVLVPDYLMSVGDFLLAAAIAVIVATTLVHAAGRPWVRKAMRSAKAGIASVGIIATLSLLTYAYWIRPHLPPFTTIHSELVPALNGTRDFREHALPNLIAYLGLPTVLMAAIGACAWTWRIHHHRIAASRFMVPAVLLLPILVYLWNPLVSPDHPWASRRWIPAVIPGVLVLSALGAAAVTARFPRRARNVAAIVATVALSASLLVSQRETLLFEEDAGLIDQVAAISAFLPSDRPSYVLDWDPLASALLAGFGKPIVPLRSTRPGPQSAESLGLAADCSDTRPCLVLHDRSISIRGPGTHLHAHGTIRRQRRNVDTTALAHGTHAAAYDYFVTRIGSP